MKEQTGATYQSSQFDKTLFVAPAKVGKSCFEIASCLGAMPNQDKGGVVAHPQELHVITFDASALEGIQGFLTKSCGVGEEALGFKVYNMQDDVSKLARSDAPYDGEFYGALFHAIDRAAQKMAGQKSPVLVFASLTMAAEALLRALAGPVMRGDGTMQKSTMDMNKWNHYNMQLAEVRNVAQQDGWHTIWEAHLYSRSTRDPNTGVEAKEDSLHIQGSTGQNWACNVGHPFGLKRKFGQKWAGSNVDQVAINTRLSGALMGGGGRQVNEKLEAEEYDLAEVYRKLGYKVGNYVPPRMAHKTASAGLKQAGAVSSAVKSVSHSNNPKPVTTKAVSTAVQQRK